MEQENRLSIAMSNVNIHQMIACLEDMRIRLIRDGVDPNDVKIAVCDAVCGSTKFTVKYSDNGVLKIIME